jgi:hypothetical protein
MLCSIFIDTSHFYIIEVVSIGTHLNFYYIHDSFIPFLFSIYWLQAVYFINTCPLVCLYVIFFVIKPLGIKKRNSILQIKVMLKQWSTKLWIIKMNTKLHSVVSLSARWLQVTFMYVSRVIREMSKMPCKKYLNGSEKWKKKLKQVHRSCQKLAL